MWPEGIWCNQPFLCNQYRIQNKPLVLPASLPKEPGILQINTELQICGKNKSASPEVEEKAEFKAATELVAKCQYHSLQGSIKRSIWQAGPPGWENKAVEHSPRSPAVVVLCPDERHPPHFMCHSRGGTIVIGSCKTGVETAGCKTLPIPRAVADAPLHPTDAPLHPTDAPLHPTDVPLHPTDAKSPFPCSSWGLPGWFYNFTSEIPSTFGRSHSTTHFYICY